MKFMPLTLLSIFLVADAVGAEDGVPAVQSGIEFFEKKIRPVLVEHCYECHSADSKSLKGGLRLLISRGFFKTKKSLGATRQELVKHDYHYSAASIQTTLNRLSTRTGPLAAFKEDGKKVYVRRK